MWNSDQKKAWFRGQKISRSYKKDVLDKLSVWQKEGLIDLQEYAALSINPERYPLVLAKDKSFSIAKPIVLITGGVHGYETSGVLATLAFIEKLLVNYQRDFSLLIFPCISPWAYETVNRWNNQCIDPNRSFYDHSLQYLYTHSIKENSIDKCEESQAVIAAIRPFKDHILAHIDLHETTDTDNTVFRPALMSRDAIALEYSEIPDGFYLVADSLNPCAAMQKFIIQQVAKVTHIAPADANQCLIGSKITDLGVIRYPFKSLGLCAGISNARYTTTTEVYPDSQLVDQENCVLAQLTAIQAMFSYIKQQRGSSLEQASP